MEWKGGSGRKGVYGDLLRHRGPSASPFNGLEHLFDDLRVQNCATVERNRDSQDALAVDAVTALGPEQFEASAEQRAFSFDCRPPG